jgi:hypothetical protein
LQSPFQRKSSSSASSSGSRSVSTSSSDSASEAKDEKKQVKKQETEMAEKFTFYPKASVDFAKTLPLIGNENAFLGDIHTS